MGLTSSKPVNPYAELKALVSRLGDRNPFGDDEILRISRCMTYLSSIRSKSAPNANPNFSADEDGNHTAKNNINELYSESFLSDWAVFCSTLPPADFSPPEDGGSKYRYTDLLSVDSNLLLESSFSAETIKRQRRIKYITTIIEKHVLPENFGETLSEKYFTLLAPMKNHSQDLEMQNKNGNSSQSPTQRIAWERLDKFMDGASETSRRGSRKSLTCIYKCCTSNEDDNASAKDLIDLAYRLALASSIYKQYMKNQIEMEDQQERLRIKALEKEQRELKKQKEIERVHYDDEDNIDDEEESEEEEEEEEIIAPFDPSTLFPQEIGESLTTSLLQYAEKNMGPGSGLDSGFHGAAHESSATGGTTDKNKVPLDIFLAWADTAVPCLSSTIETFMHQIFFPDKPYPPSRCEMVFPNLRKRHSAFVPRDMTNSDSSPLLFSFVTMSPSLGGAWHRLYTSDSDGLSFNRLQNALLGYSGPSLIIIKEADTGGIFGAYTSTAWKESKDFYGNSDCFLYTIKPSVQVLRPNQRGTGSNFMYCNPESRSRGYDGLAHGIGFGGTTLKPRLFISEAFDGCMAGSGDLTFEPGRLLPPREDGNPSAPKYFDLESLEVWGVGGDAITMSALTARHKQREIVASNIRKARKVDKAAFLDDFRSGLIESKAFKHRAEMRGRGDCHIDAEDQNNYVYD